VRKKLYLIPGTMCNEKLWRELLPYLRHDIELVYLTIPQNKTFDELAEHYNTVFGNEKVCLAGFSLGGYIATYFAMLHPERIEKLFIISNSPTRLPDDELNQRNDTLNYVETYGYKGMSRTRVSNFLDNANQNDDLINCILTMESELGESEFLSQYRYTSQRPDLSLALKQFSFDTHIYYSEHDNMVNAQWLSELADSNPNLLLIRTSGSGHMLPLEKPQELAAHINTWIAR